MSSAVIHLAVEDSVWDVRRAVAVLVVAAIAEAIPTVRVLVDGGGGGGGDGQTAADQLYAFVKAATSFHASCITCLLHSSEASAEPSNIWDMQVPSYADPDQHEFNNTLETSQAEMPGWLNQVAE